MLATPHQQLHVSRTPHAPQRPLTFAKLVPSGLSPSRASDVLASIMSCPTGDAGGENMSDENMSDDNTSATNKTNDDQ